MSRLRAITERDRLGELVAKLEAGEEVDYDLASKRQAADIAQAGRAALLDALDREDAAMQALEEQLGEVG